jgi:hypothetical protein
MNRLCAGTRAGLTTSRRSFVNSYSKSQGLPWLKPGATSREEVLAVPGLDDAEIARRLGAPMI